MADKAPVRKKTISREGAGDGWRRLGFVLLIIGLGIVTVAGGQIGGSVIADYLLGYFGNLQGIQETFVQYLIIQAIVVLLLIGISYAFRSTFRELGLGKIKNWTYMLLMPFIYIATLILGGIASLLAALLFPGYDATQAQELGLPTTGDGSLLFTGLFLVVAVPLAEEFIFRGYLFGLLRRYLSLWSVTIIVSLIFAIAHGQPNVAINVFVLSIALCYIREKTGSIWTGVALHALKNFIAFLLLFVFNVV